MTVFSFLLTILIYLREFLVNSKIHWNRINVSYPRHLSSVIISQNLAQALAKRPTVHIH